MHVFSMKDENLINIMKLGKKLSVLSKKIREYGGLISNKKYLKVENKINTKEGSHCTCKWVMLTDSVYKKMESIILKSF